MGILCANCVETVLCPLQQVHTADCKRFIVLDFHAQVSFICSVGSLLSSAQVVFELDDVMCCRLRPWP